jgi:hypothetical protein
MSPRVKGVYKFSPRVLPSFYLLISSQSYFSMETFCWRHVLYGKYEKPVKNYLMRLEATSSEFDDPEK